MKIIKNIFFILLISIGIFFRFYNLNWGSPFYFHPDERNIIYSVLQLSFSNFNPNFFAYGSLPIYNIFFLDSLLNIFNHSPISFNQAILTGRFFSFLLSCFSLYLIYQITLKIKNKNAALIALILSTFSVGFIQFSHFLTFETWLIFLNLLFLFLCLKQYQKSDLKNFILASVVFGLFISIKIIATPYLLIYLIILFETNRKNLKKFFSYSLSFITISILIFIVTNPFTFLDRVDFLNSINYESSVALGNINVFYTQEFINTKPFIFQFLHTLPFLLNPIVEIIFIISFLYLIYLVFIKRDFKYFIILLFIFLTIFPSFIFFVKWTRYTFLVLPFVYICIGIFLDDLRNLFRKTNFAIKYSYVSFILIIFLFSFIFSFSYFKTVYLTTDSRIQAFNFLVKNTSSNTHILSESYDLGIIPFNSYFKNITLFDFYDLENNSGLKTNLPQLLESNDFIILPSQRIMKTRFLNAKYFPLGNKFYVNLFNNKLGYVLIYQTNCDNFCRIIYINNPVFAYEETVNVFDRPQVFVFKKYKQLSLDQYKNILNL